MTPKSMSSEVENIEIKAKNRVGSKHIQKECLMSHFTESFTDSGS